MTLNVHITPMHHGRIIDKNDSLEECMNMGSNYVQVVVNNFNENFLIFLCLMHTSCLTPSIIQLKKRHVSMCVNIDWKG
jgi:hypothetical protein